MIRLLVFLKHQKITQGKLLALGLGVGIMIAIYVILGIPFYILIL